MKEIGFKMIMDFIHILIKKALNQDESYVACKRWKEAHIYKRDCS